MNGRILLMHRKHLSGFKAWLMLSGKEILEPIGEYEVMRWKGIQGQPMPIIFWSTTTPSLTVGIGAEKDVWDYFHQAGQVKY